MHRFVAPQKVAKTPATLIKDVCRRALTGKGYVNETDIPTFHFQKSLPVLPIPKLEDSLQRYLKSAAPLVSSDKLAHTKTLVEQFGTRDQGQALQEELLRLMKTDFKGSSFISKFWFDKYLEDRACLPVNYNPMITFKDDTNPQKMDQAARAASLIYSSIGFYRTLRDKQLEPDIFHTKPKKSKTPLFNTVIKALPSQVSWYGGFLAGAYALDMSQYDNLFLSTRIPKKGKDVIETFQDSRHVVVQRGTDFFSFPVLTESGDSVSHAEIEANIRAILAKRESKSPSVSLLTSMDRDKWAEARDTLLGLDAKNRESIHDIDSALFAVCLEDEAPEGIVNEARSMLHGNGRNRWFDKSFQLIVNAKGRAAVNFEHSWGDGVAVLRYFNEVYADSITQSSLDASQLPPPSTDLKMLEWLLNDEIVATSEQAGRDLDALLGSIHMENLDTEAVYPRFLKKKDIGADGTFQMGFQLAHYKMYGFSGSTYESASTSAFKHGRTETIRSATIESDLFCKVMTNPSASDSDKEAALRIAVTNHGALTKDALTGKGWDRHLFALKRLAESKGESFDLYSDETYGVLSNIILSTSTLSSPALDGGGFGPVGDDCYGLMYGTNGDVSRFGVMSYHGEQQTKDFTECLASSFEDIRKVLGN